jgi:glycosyltransferase involved in cell wall biosynthesis
LKVALITSTFPSPDKPSLGIFNLRAAKALAASCDLTVYKLRTWKPGRKRFEEMHYEGLRVKTYALPLLPFNNIYGYVVSSYIAALFLRKEISSRQYDILFSSGIDFGGLLTALITPHTSARHVAQVIGSDVNFDLPKISKLGLMHVYRKGVHGILCVCNDLMAQVNRMMPFVTDVAVAYRGIDLNAFQPSPLPDIPGTRFLFLGGFPGGIGDDGINLKGGITLTSLWKQNEERFHELGFSLTVGGVNASGDFVRQWHASLRYPGSVTLVGTVPSPQAHALIKESHIVLVPSLAEGLPNIAVESAALGRVVIGSRVNGVPEIVLDGTTGVLLPPREPQPWIDAIIKYGQDKDTLQKMATAARAHVESNFNAASFGPAVTRLFHQILSAAR